MSKIKRLYFVFLILIFNRNPGIAQNTYASSQIDSLIREISETTAENLGEDYDLSDLIERLNLYVKHPINLNHTTASQLKELAFLSPIQIGNFLEHLQQSGELKDQLELQAIKGFDIQTINKLLLFARVIPQSKLKDLSTDHLFYNGDHDLIFRYGRILQTQKGFKSLPGSRYLGTPDKLLLRYHYSYTDLLSVSIIAEKDPGEYLLRKGSLADHLSFNIVLLKQGRFKKLVVGDYSLQFGQGLTLWSGFAFGKGPDVTSVASKDLGLRPYNSSNEASFFRGVASTIVLSRSLEITPFISFRKLDASLKLSDTAAPTLQNINISGLHRTATELRNQKSLGQLVYGAALQYAKEGLSVGIVGYRSNYQYDFTTGSQQYNKYAFTGKDLINSGLNYSYTFKNVYLFGELSNSIKTGWATVNGAMLSLSSKLSAVVLHRNYDRDYHNFFSNGIGEATEISNEKGLYAGLNYLPFRKWSFSCYTDYFKFPWLKYRVDSPSSGYEIFGQGAYTPSKLFKILLRYKRELKQQNPDVGVIRNHLDDICKQSCRLDWSWQINRKFSFHQRMELLEYQKGNAHFPLLKVRRETGCAILQDFDYKPPLHRLSGNIRLAYFNTPSYDSRIYAYEDDVLYGASSGAYNGKGIRGYVNIRFGILKEMDMWIRYAIYIYKNQTTTGSGLDEINGNKKSDFKIQLRYRF